MAVQGEVIVYDDSSKQEFLEHVKCQRKPAILRGCYVGECVARWTPEYLCQKVGNVPVKIHVSPTPEMDFVNKNFTYKTLPFDELIRRASTGVQSDYFIHPHELYYLRSLGTEPRGTDVADFYQHFPRLSGDFKLPKLFEEDQYFSSVFRVSSPGLCLWTHYDIMDNVLVQISGDKKVVLFDPSDALNLYLIGDKSRIIDPYDTSNPEFPLFKNAKRYESVIIPGDILFIPALWLHHVQPVNFSVAVNVFWKNLNKEFYDKKDTYGNKDVVPGARALQGLQNAIKSLSSLPREYRDFYYRRMIAEIEKKLECGVKNGV